MASSSRQLFTRFQKGYHITFILMVHDLSPFSTIIYPWFFRSKEKVKFVKTVFFVCKIREVSDCDSLKIFVLKSWPCFLLFSHVSSAVHELRSLSDFWIHLAMQNNVVTNLYFKWMFEEENDANIEFFKTWAVVFWVCGWDLMFSSLGKGFLWVSVISDGCFSLYAWSCSGWLKQKRLIV